MATQALSSEFYIETSRLYISRFQPENNRHCDFLVQLYNTPEFIASIGGKPTSVVNRETAWERISGRFKQEHERNGYGTYLVSLKSPFSTMGVPFSDVLAQCEPIGTVSLTKGDSCESFTAPDLGFAILPEHMRNSYAAEAARGLLKHAAEYLGVHAVFGLFDPTNEASKGVFRKLGFEDREIRPLKPFGGIRGAIWASLGTDADLSVYGFD
ncbi:hypothetical protein SLS56_011126 [Neofusicoccum ribis]|uniref:N-acetyltransferase domain-containing protein n=1 Tax=Neofusicoccum ribis TaxID=45134 RepID=A0ABR3SCI0_9PEZI